MNHRFIIFLTSILLIAAVVGGVVYVEWSEKVSPALGPPPAEAAPMVTWTLNQVVETVGQGQEKTTTVSFTSDTNLSNVVVQIVPELQPYVVSATPSSFSFIGKGDMITLTLTLSAPPDAQLGTFDGTLYLRDNSGKSKETYAKPLPVTLIVFSSIANAPNPEKVLEELTSDLRSGNINAALQKVAPSRHNQVRALDSNGLNRLADFLANAHLVEETPNLRVYKGTFVDKDGRQWEGEFTQVFELGQWKIIVW